MIDLLGRTDLGALERPFTDVTKGSSWPLIRNLLISAVFFGAIAIGLKLMKD